MEPVESKRKIGLKAKGLSRLSEDMTLLDNVSMSIGGGDRVGVTGPTGSGKSVLLRALALLDPLDSGEIEWNGESMRGNLIPEYRSQVIYLHQRPAFSDLTVEEALRQPFLLRVNRDRSFGRQRIVNWLQELGFDESFLSKQCQDLSGGEAQVTALLRAIQLDPQVLLLDESTSALDSNTESKVEELIANWANEVPGQRALVWVSHDLQQIERRTTTHLKMQKGGKVEGG